MSFISMSVTGIRTYIAKLVGASAATEAMQPTALKKAGFLVERRAKQIVTEKDIIDTGLLRLLIGVVPSDEPNTIEIISQADYSIYNEYGTYKMDARPYMRPALEEMSPEIYSLIGKTFVRSVYGAMGNGGKIRESYLY